MTQPGLLVLMGGGGQAAVATETARAAGYHVAGCLDDDPGVRDTLARLDLAYLGGIDDLARVLDEMDDDTLVHVAVGDNQLRERWLGQLESTCPQAMATPILHPSAVISPTARLQAGVFVGPGAIVNARAAIGHGVIINSGAIVEHDVVIGTCAHVAPGAVLGGAARVGEGSLIGLGARVLPRISVGAWATLGAGAVLTEDLAPQETAAGVPAKVIVSASI